MMNKLKLGHDIHKALRHSLAEQQRLLCHKRREELLPVIERLARFNLKLEEWYSGKYHLNDHCKSLMREAQRIEVALAKISKDFCDPIRINLARTFRRIQERRETSVKDKSYPTQLRVLFDHFRFALLEQYAGARLLVNNSDMGDELERILVQYLDRRFNGSVRILRGGHIFDYNGKSSHHQKDIIITPANALPFCPAGTNDGKYNVMIDQVIAVISVTSRLFARGLRKRYQQLQKISELKQAPQNSRVLGGYLQPYCYIVGAECDDLKALEKTWEDLESPSKTNLLQMIYLLDSGYIRLRPIFVEATGESHCELWSGTDDERGLCAGLGLGWLEAQIAERNCVLTNQPLEWVHRLREQLFCMEARDASPLT